jgi:translation elongation factor EF-Tu-like GTPase
MHLRIKLMVLPTEFGGRRSPVYWGYRVDWSLSTTSLTLNGGVVKTLESTTRINPGEIAEVHLFPFVKDLWAGVAVGHQLRMQEGARIIGIATVLEVIDGL